MSGSSNVGGCVQSRSSTYLVRHKILPLLDSHQATWGGSYPGTVKPYRVALVEPVAYPKSVILLHWGAMRYSILAFLSFVLITVVAATCWAQKITATVAGDVTDAS